MTLLQIDNLSLSILGLNILSSVRFEVDRGEVVGVIGESGSGKSMTAMSVMQLLPHGTKVSGSIRLDGEELLSKSEREMCRVRGSDVGMVFQEPMTALNPVKTIGDQVAETVMIHKGVRRLRLLRSPARP